MSPITVIADDLSGAAETAEQFRLRGHETVVSLGVPAGPAAAVTVVDVGTRAGTAEEARVAIDTLPLTTGALVLKKTDSLWRGHVGPELEALAARGYDLVVAGALPALGRTVVHGRPLVDGRPLAETPFWHLEPHGAPSTLAELVDRPTVLVGLDVVRSGPDASAAHLDAALAGGAVLLVDAETDDDLAAVVDAVLRLVAAPGVRRPVALAGSAALAAALADAVAPESSPEAGFHASDGAGVRDEAGPRDGAERPVLVVVGSAAEVARGHADALAATGADVHVLDPADDAGLLVEATRASLSRSSVAVLTVTARRLPDPLVGSAALAEVVARIDADVELDLVLTGGETARAVLDRLTTTTLRPLAQLEHGAVLSLAGDGRGAAGYDRLVATKPGSFGGPTVLADLVDLVRRTRAGADPHDLTASAASGAPTKRRTP
ncbi:four-carbon acid sugar kinase family protein [Frigoribacterium sp. NPDC087798]|uniref:four-carbon acid sugar kinase family protein n=1 Tax=Frigoribacterium sp. NPDC087798 TaxID=3363993 RepID=UPI0037F6E5AC